MCDWQPIATKPPFTHCEERGEYRDNGEGLWYFKPTHWRPLTEKGAPNLTQDAQGGATLGTARGTSK